LFLENVHVGRTVLEGGVVHVPDVLADPEYARLDAQKISGHRAAFAGGKCRRRDLRDKNGAAAVHRQADRAGEDIRRSGGDLLERVLDALALAPVPDARRKAGSSRSR
jgi:hypothetical protein